MIKNFRLKFLMERTMQFFFSTNDYFSYRCSSISRRITILNTTSIHANIFINKLIIITFKVGRREELCTKTKEM